MPADRLTGWNEMVQLATQAATTHSFNEAALRQSLSAIAQRSHATDEDIERALEEGWKQGVANDMSDGIISREEEERLRAFRNHLALEDNAADADAVWDLDQASGQRLMLEARLAAISVQDGDGHLRDLEDALQEAAWTSTNEEESSSEPGRPPSRGPWRTACCPWTRRTRWPSTPPTSVWSSTTWTGTASRPASYRRR